MAYRPLNKLYYEGQDLYLQTYRARFESEDAVTLSFEIAQHPAFFLQDAEVMRLAYEIMKLDRAVTRLSAALPGIAKAQYSKKCLIDEIVLTNRIEGVHSSRKEIDDALEILEKQSDEKGKHQRFVGLVHKYLKLLTGEPIPLKTCQDIRAIYDELFLDEVIAEGPQHATDGTIFRKGATAVHSAAGKEIHRGLYPESRIIHAMERALAFLNDEPVDKLFRICIFHYLIEHIHPFYDGNGRLGRFILSCCLSETLEPLLSYRISETIKENITGYYRAFEICNDPRDLGDLTPFLIMMLHMIRAALRELEGSLTRRSIRWARYESLVPTFPGADDIAVRRMYSYLIQAALFSEKGISTKELEVSFEASYYKVKKLLDRIDPRLLRSEPRGRNKYYQLDLTALDEILLRDGLEKSSETSGIG